MAGGILAGGKKGIGAATAVRLSRLGARVALVAREYAEAMRGVESVIRAGGSEPLVLQADVSDADACRAIVAKTVAHFGRLDILVHAAGGPSKGRIADVTPDDFHRTLKTHVESAFHLAQSAAGEMARRESSAIVLIGSIAGVRGIGGAFSYGVAKGAIEQMTRMLAVQLARQRTRVNAVSPGIIRTDFHRDMPEQVRRHNIDNRIPLAREGTPDDVADAICFLVQHAYITGVSLPVDGGLACKNA